MSRPLPPLLQQLRDKVDTIAKLPPGPNSARVACDSNDYITNSIGNLKDMDTPAEIPAERWKSSLDSIFLKTGDLENVCTADGGPDTSSEFIASIVADLQAGINDLVAMFDD